MPNDAYFHFGVSRPSKRTWRTLSDWVIRADQQPAPPLILYPRKGPVKERLTNADAMVSAAEVECRLEQNQSGPYTTVRRHGRSDSMCFPCTLSRWSASRVSLRCITRQADFSLWRPLSILTRRPTAARRIVHFASSADIGLSCQILTAYVRCRSMQTNRPKSDWANCHHMR